MKKVVQFMSFFAVFAVTVYLANSIYAAETNFLKGLTIGGGVTLNLQNLQNANKAEDDEGNMLDKNKTPTIGQYSIDLTIEKKFDNNNTAFIHLETGKGNINYYLNSVAGINAGANDSGVVRVTEAWLNHKFTDKFVVTVGIINPADAVDKNAYAND